jgi:hypothetical protein
LFLAITLEKTSKTEIKSHGNGMVKAYLTTTQMIKKPQTDKKAWSKHRTEKLFCNV